MKNNLALIFLLLPLFIMAQERHLIKGRIAIDDFGVSEVLVVNFSAEKETRTDNLGNFSIAARIGDLIIVSGEKIISKRIRYTQDLITNGELILPVQPSAIELEEVVITKYKAMNPEDLGLVPRGQKQYTPAEKRVFTATNGIDGIINAITGRTKMLKKAAKYEKKWAMISKISLIYNDDDIIENFGIPQEFVQGFLFYSVEDTTVVTAVTTKNTLMLKKRLQELSPIYLDLLNDAK